jgi:pimeloyl-ACP methyl ester carboxylesterase
MIFFIFSPEINAQTTPVDIFRQFDGRQADTRQKCVPARCRPANNGASGLYSRQHDANGKHHAGHTAMNTHRESSSQFLPIRGLQYHVRHWGDPAAPQLFMLHGWMDSSATFQFVVDALSREWHVIAPDWRGYGASEWLNRAYWFPDYYADLDALLGHFSPDAPAQLVGHSMGANIAAMVAAARPERVARLIMLDFLGLLATPPEQAPAQLAQWLKNLQENQRLGSYENFAALARRLQQSNPRLNSERAAFLARHVGHQRADGRVAMACDPWHRVPAPTLYAINDVLAAWRAITCPVHLAIAEHGFVEERFGHNPAEFQRRIDCFRQLGITRISDAGHNVQHDQPEKVAALIESLLSHPQASDNKDPGNKLRG